MKLSLEIERVQSEETRCFSDAISDDYDDRKEAFWLKERVVNHLPMSTDGSQGGSTGPGHKSELNSSAFSLLTQVNELKPNYSLNDKTIFLHFVFQALPFSGQALMSCSFFLVI